MKRILFATLAVMAVAALTSAQTPTPAPSPVPAKPGVAAVGPNFVDANGDGICDRYQGGSRRGKGYGPGDGTGNQGVGPRDGSGYGPGSGNCDGTGPKGQGRRGPRR